MTDKPQIHFIQALRAIAAMMVLIWHFKPKGESASPTLDFLFFNGFAGVDIFFVISGFIMVYTTGGRRGGAKQALLFLAKRIARIWPLYAFGTLLYVVFLFSLGWLTSDYASKSVLSLAFYPVPPHPVLDVGWTLNIEMYFYIVFAACLAFDKLRWIVASIWVFATILAQMGNYNFSFIPESISFVLPLLIQAVHPCIPEFFAGMLIALFFMSGIKIKKSVAIPVASILISFAAWQYIDGFYNRPGIYGMGASAISLVLALAIAEKSGFGWRPGRLVMWIGNISFSIYILHTTVGLAVTRFFMGTDLSSYTHGVGYVVFITVIVLSLSAVTHEYIEKRASSRLSRYIESKLS